MNLGFKTTFENGQLTYFKKKIQACFLKADSHELIDEFDGIKPKKHTLRHDPTCRWNAGRLIHFCTGVRTKYYDCFLVESCVSVQHVDLFFTSTMYRGGSRSIWCQVVIDGRLLTKLEAEAFAVNDGFSCLGQLCLFFYPTCKRPVKCVTETYEVKDLKLIHWTDLTY